MKTKLLHESKVVLQPPKESWVTPKVEIRPSPPKGAGMFATQQITAGEEVIVYGGTFISGVEAMREKAKGKLVMRWDDDCWSAEDRGDDPSYFINHSCDSNCWMQGAWTVVAKRNIDVGEEVTADYVLWETDENYISKWTCYCGEPLCRCKVTGRDWEIQILQDRYFGHFTPLIEKKIRKSKE